MDIATIDSEYEQLEAKSQQTIQLLTALANKLNAASAAGDQNARDWMLDLKEIAIGVRDEEAQTTQLLQAIHSFVANQVAQQPAQPAPQYVQQQPVYQQQPAYQQPYYGGGGGMFGRFLGGGFGRAIAMGAGFGIGDDIINSIF